LEAFASYRLFWVALDLMLIAITRLSDVRRFGLAASDPTVKCQPNEGNGSPIPQHERI
jgi:hypothetical protein